MNSHNPVAVLLGYQLCDALMLDDRVMFDTLMACQPDLTVSRKVSGKTLRPLEIAIREGREYPVKTLIEAGAPLGPNPVLLNDPIQAGLLQPFMLAGILEHWGFCREILGATDLHTRARWLIQGMREATSQGWDHWIDPLLELGAQPNAMTEQGNTPLCFAVIGGNTIVIDKLLAAGADWQLTNSQEQSAADLLRANRPDLAERYGLSERGSVVRLSDRIRPRQGG